MLKREKLHARKLPLLQYLVYYTTKVLVRNILWKIVQFLSVFWLSLMLWNFKEKQFWGENLIFLKKKRFLNFLFKKKKKKVGSALHIRVGWSSTTKQFFWALCGLTFIALPALQNVCTTNFLFCFCLYSIHYRIGTWWLFIHIIICLTIIEYNSLTSYYHLILCELFNHNNKNMITVA